MTMNLNTSTALNVNILCALFPLALATAKGVLLQAGFSGDDTSNQQFVLSRIRVEDTEDGYSFSVNTGTANAHVCVIEVKPVATIYPRN